MTDPPRIRRPTTKPAVFDTEQVFAKQLSAKRGMSQAALAERCSKLGSSLDRSAIAKIESGSRGVSLNDAIQLCAALNASPGSMFFWAEKTDGVLIGPDLAVTAGVARAWLRDQRPLKTDDDRRSWEDTVADDVPTWAAEARAIYAMVEDLNEYLIPMEAQQLDAQGVEELGELVNTMKGVLEQMFRRAKRFQREAGQ